MVHIHNILKIECAGIEQANDLRDERNALLDELGGLMNISYKELNHIEIPRPSIEEQRVIAEEYEKELEVYKKAIQAAENRWSSTLARLQGRI